MDFSFKELKSEFKRIVWPDRKELTQKTLIVIVFCAIFSAIIGVFDWIFVSVRDLITGLFGV